MVRGWGAWEGRGRQTQAEHQLLSVEGGWCGNRLVKDKSLRRGDSQAGERERH